MASIDTRGSILAVRWLCTTRGYLPISDPFRCGKDASVLGVASLGVPRVPFPSYRTTCSGYNSQSTTGICASYICWRYRLSRLGLDGGHVYVQHLPCKTHVKYTTSTFDTTWHVHLCWACWIYVCSTCRLRKPSNVSDSFKLLELTRL